jgi:hypothetical protein
MKARKANEASAAWKTLGNELAWQQWQMLELVRPPCSRPTNLSSSFPIYSLPSYPRNSAVEKSTIASCKRFCKATILPRAK